MSLPMPSKEVSALIKEGIAIPASPLALTKDKEMDVQSLKAIYRYYIDAGAKGIAVGVHSTQFEIRDPEFNLFRPLLKLAIDEMKAIEKKKNMTIVKVGGVCGKTAQALEESKYLAELGYDAALLSLAALNEETEDEIIEHCRKVAANMPIIGFYLQTSIGGRMLPYSFWKKFAQIENVIAIKVASFNRYQTIDVVRAVLDSGNEDRITLYTGNDDNIINDLMTPYQVKVNGELKTVHFQGGLLGQFCVWTKKAVEVLEEIKKIRTSSDTIKAQWLTKNVEYTDANGAVFDVVNRFAGCISGINEVLRQQGLMKYSHCLCEHEQLSPGQLDELNRVRKAYPWLIDDDFVKEHLEEWLDT